MKTYVGPAAAALVAALSCPPAFAASGYYPEEFVPDAGEYDSEASSGWALEDVTEEEGPPNYELRRTRSLQGEETPWGVEMVEAVQLESDHGPGGTTKTVCIMDSGYDATHPDLPSSSPGVSGYENWAQDDCIGNGAGHGTNIAGIIAAEGGNGQGLVGIKGNTPINLFIVKVFGGAGCPWTYATGITGALDRCVEGGADVVSMNFVGKAYDDDQSDAFKTALNDGNVLLVGAAGNDGHDRPMFPASYSSVISVGAINENKTVSSISQHNSWVDLVAPGVSVKSTNPGGTYVELSGTGFAAPHVSGVAALIWSHFPDCTARQIRHALFATAEDLGDDGRDDYYGNGLVRASAAWDYLTNNNTCDDSWSWGENITDAEAAGAV